MTRESFDDQKDKLLQELKQIEEFRRGTINKFYRKCGKKRCVCTTEGHPGHGPQITLTYSDQGRTRGRNLPTHGAVELAMQQLHNRKKFVDWAKRWRDLNEKISDHKLEEVLSGKESKSGTAEKKPRRRSSKRSHGRSRD